ncbi:MULTISPECIES: hypothetical protein [Micromonospora]|uniref:Uncharacterized protein n=1 Tax=Micromonospora humida TaxID=2809018 RepID=A0ABS2INC0_9ACTN|nr:hypothetical protein [Micromonospora humida]MBM7075840.1 hypothetical protein [Micromonospora humida]
MMPNAGDDRRILLIATNDTFCHVYQNLADLLSTADHGEKLAGAVEFFDVTGRRLHPVFSADWRLEALQAGTGPAVPDVVRQRLTAVIAHVTQYIHDHPDVLARSRISLERALSELPRLDDPDLSEIIGALPEHLEHDTGNWLHNAMHAAGWAD